MDFRLLGPLEVIDGGRQVALGGAKQRALLALLLLNAGRVVTADRIVSELWGDDSPDTAANAIQVYVANLRKILDPGRAAGVASDILVTRTPGYMLRVKPEDVDVLRFEELADDARRLLISDPAKAADLLRKALALWRGPALAGVVFEGSARGEITRLEELRVSALEDRIQSDLELGRHAALVGELDVLVAAHPHRERLHAQLMLALYRCGRQGEALKAYREARRMLVDDLGIEPSVELQSLEKAILKQDPSLAAPARVAERPTADVRGSAEAAGPPSMPPARPEEARTAHGEATSQSSLAPPPRPPELAPPPSAGSPPESGTRELVGSPPPPPAREHVGSPAAPPQREQVGSPPAPPEREHVGSVPAPAAREHAGSAPASPARELRGSASVPPTKEPIDRPRRGRWRRELLVVCGLVLVLGSFGGVFVLHPWGNAGRGATPSATSTPNAGLFPNAKELALLARLPGFVDPKSCHRISASEHYAPASAEIECPVTTTSAPGISSVIYQQFEHYPDLELHYHHVLGGKIRGNSNKPLSALAHGPCAPPAFFAVSTYGPQSGAGTEPAGALAQAPDSSPLAHGHFVCYVDRSGVPHIAWTNVGWLIVAQATGTGSDSAAAQNLVDSWVFDGPVGPVPPPASAATLAAQVAYLYDRYLQRKTDDARAISFWSQVIQSSGFTAASNGFATSLEADARFTKSLQTILPGH